MSILKVNTLEEATVGGATFYTTKAWVNFNGTGTVAIRGDGGVSSITDIATGTYGANLSPVMASANYAVSGMAESYNSVDSIRIITGADGDQNTSSVLRIRTVGLNGSGAHNDGADSDYVCSVAHI